MKYGHDAEITNHNQLEIAETLDDMVIEIKEACDVDYTDWRDWDE